MDQNKSLFKKKIAIIISIALSLFLLTVFLLIIGMFMNNLKQQEMLKTTDKFINFKSQVEHLVYTNKTLVQGFEAYILMNPGLDESEAYTYLNNLLSKNENQIRNVGVCQDTTAIWNYPKEGNTAAIGVDLSKSESQKELVLKVKNEQVPILQGPVELVQGGTGFIIRLPIVRKDTGYWGQISIVLKGDKIIEDINAYAEDADLNVAIFNDQNKTVPFYGSMSTVGESALTFDIDPDFINWKVSVSPKDGWENNQFIFWSAIFLSVLIAAGAGLLTHRAIKTNDQLRIMSSHDSLTGLFNRHYLNEYQTMVLAAAKRNNRHVGFLSMDLNHFKNINDTYGHNVGDLVLVETARVLTENTRIEEAVFRLGGDEFLVIMPEMEDRTGLNYALERLTSSFENQFHLADYPAKIAVSIGTALFPEDGDNIDALLQIADEQMYADKKKQKMEG
ncbi:diguanylate cyclase [Acetobacterium fimetarium]|uniref:Diguanylate cyclase n=1 Tax=Acetobacterium fimetarium TaxID=52691 RepID=A0ABR6WUR0_9FIRM|nr:diguanylate cyclase [Acetobacterium fimetarium]MBC3804320.1 diguanylate cyclase [Acetobacterium fimetarium]